MSSLNAMKNVNDSTIKDIIKIPNIIKLRIISLPWNNDCTP
ncbi:MAG: hypothetical protein WCG25_01540 [bacterium]